MRFCRVCKAVLPDGSDSDICSKKCREVLREYKKRDYDKQRRRERWDFAGQRFCKACGAKMRRKGVYCSKCRKARGRFYVSVSEREYRIGPD